MMELDSAIVILMAEALAAMILLVLVLIFMSRKKRGNETVEIDRFISKLEDEEAIKTQQLEKILLESGVNRQALDSVLKEVTATERALLQRVIQLFLQRDLAHLEDIDQLVANLSDPYCRLLAESSNAATSVDSAVAGKEQRVAGIERVNQQLIKQLDTAMKTIDEITAEYTRVFSGNQTALELENSSKKMQQIFLEAEQRIKSSMSELEG